MSPSSALSFSSMLVTWWALVGGGQVIEIVFSTYGCDESGSQLDGRAQGERIAWEFDVCEAWVVGLLVIGEECWRRTFIDNHVKH
ncbi:hypothetical protein VNO78_18354 [Psophocarpus tetragonolobus]|uniref:Secreted protein n=1 Tax=Psophocarpus tetragonolobus TaxID=3891 RepID=A0AAN9SPS5_PSOTE